MVVFGIVAMVFAIVQAALMLFRDAALIVLAGVLPLAAAGAAMPGTRGWLRRVGSWMLALIFYKPAAAAVYATAFTMIGSGKNLQTVLTGFVMLVMSVVALSALMKFFTWTTGALASSGGGGGQLMNSAAMGAVAFSTMSARGGGAGAQDQAAFINSRLPAAPGGGPPGGAPPGGAAGMPNVGGWPAGPAGATAPGQGGGQPTGAAPNAGGAATAGRSAATGAASTGTAGATAATAGGPAGAAASAAAQAAAAGGRLATGAMDPEGAE